MAILASRTVWKRTKPQPRDDFTLTEGERANVRRALMVLRVRLGMWKRVAESVRVGSQTFKRKRHRPDLDLAFRVARLVGVPLEDVLRGEWPTPESCPLCGHVAQQPRALPAPKR